MAVKVTGKGLAYPARLLKCLMNMFILSTVM